MKKLFYLLSVFLFVTSCQMEPVLNDGWTEPKTEAGENYEITYQYREGVIVFDEEASKYITRIEADTVLYISPQMPDKYMPNVDNVLSSRIYETLPYGLGNRVLSMEKVGNDYKCVTTSAPLEDIFADLKMKASVNVLVNESEEGFYDDDGLYWEFAKDEPMNTRKPLVASDRLNIKLGTNKNQSFYATGVFSIGARAEIDIDLLDRRADCSLALDAGLRGELGVKDSWKGYNKMFSKKDFLKLTPFSIGPVVFRPHVDLELGMQGNVSGKISTKFSKMYGTKVGIKDGTPFQENNTSGDMNILENIVVDGKGSVDLVCSPVFGLGLYTRKLAFRVKPKVTAGFSTDFRLDNQNLFREAPTLDFGIDVGGHAMLVAKAFGIKFVNVNKNLGTVRLFTYNWPLLPTLVENTTVVDKVQDEPLKFTAKYAFQGGLLAKFMDITPAFRVYRGSNEVYYVVDNKKVDSDGLITANFELNNLMPDIAYTGKPCMIINGKLFDEDGISFSSSTPTAVITDMVQTGSAEGAFEHRGNIYKYEFYYYTNVELRGADKCREWGLYNENSEEIHYPIELKEGRTTFQWVGYSNSPSMVTNVNAYVILKETGEYKYFEEHSLNLYHGTSTRGMSAAPSNSDFAVRLVSVTHEPFH